MSRAHVIAPDSNFRQKWDLVQVLLLIYVALVVPYRIGFDKQARWPERWFMLDMCIDVYFVTDLFLNFRTAAHNADGELVYGSSQIAIRYFQGWFPIDFVSCLPFGYVEYMGELL
eukprot:SAG11_NODE_5109_length_1662_cov_1.055662_1_plen_115_part_00